MLEQLELVLAGIRSMWRFRYGAMLIAWLVARTDMPGRQLMRTKKESTGPSLPSCGTTAVSN